jgi:CcmD family protein
MNNAIFLAAAYMIIWGGLFAYLFFANAQQHKLARRLRILEEIVAEQEEKK